MTTKNNRSRTVGTIGIVFGAAVIMLSILAIVLMISDGYALVAILPALAVVAGLEILLASVGELNSRVLSIRRFFNRRVA